MSAGVRKAKRTAVFVSGSGSTLQALLEFQHQFPIHLVVTNKKNVLALVKAKRFAVPVIHFKKTDSYTDLTSILRSRNVECLFLAGFMRLLPAGFVQQWEGRIFNIHPSLLPKFPGLHALEKSYQEKALMGVTIHHVTKEMDAGQKFLQQQALTNKLSSQIPLDQASYFLRRTEQHLLREFAIRKGL